MNHYPPFPEYQNQPLRLTSEELQDPQQVLARFIKTFSLPQVRQNLWQLTETALTTEDGHYDTAAERDAALHFYYEAEKLFEAIWKMEENVKVMTDH